MADSTGKAEALGQQFDSVFIDDTPETANLRQEGQNYPPIDLIIREEDIEKLLTGLNQSKASGPYQIPAHLLK